MCVDLCKLIISRCGDQGQKFAHRRFRGTNFFTGAPSQFAAFLGISQQFSMSRIANFQRPHCLKAGSHHRLRRITAMITHSINNCPNARQRSVSQNS